MIKDFYNFTEGMFLRRCANALILLNKIFYKICCKNPDIYGLFWIFTTLIFIIAASGEASSFLHGDLSQNYYADFVPQAATLIYGLGFGLPAGLAFSMKCFGTTISYPLLLCIYGYSFTSFIPIL